MTVSISFHGRTGDRFIVETRHYPEGTETDRAPYDQIKVRGSGNSEMTFYIDRQFTRTLGNALKRLDVNYPVPEESPVFDAQIGPDGADGYYERSYGEDAYGQEWVGFYPGDSVAVQRLDDGTYFAEVAQGHDKDGGAFEGPWTFEADELVVGKEIV